MGERTGLKGAQRESLMAKLHEEILALHHTPGRSPEEESQRRDQVLHAVELEMLADAFAARDPTVVVRGDWVVAEMKGFMAEVRRPREEVEAAIVSRNTLSSGDSKPQVRRVLPCPTGPIALGDTLATTLHIVMPQHVNSSNVLFGGQLMTWIEAVAAIAAESVEAHDAGSEYNMGLEWVTASMDQLEFKQAAVVGEILVFRAVVLKVWKRSVEVYVCVHSGLSCLASLTASIVI